MFMHSSSHDSEMVVHAVGADMNFAWVYEAADILAEKKKLPWLSSKFQVKSGFFYCGTLRPTVSINIRGRRKWVKFQFGPNYPFICSHNK